jgi:hypothetical protein
MVPGNERQYVWNFSRFISGGLCGEDHKSKKSDPLPFDAKKNISILAKAYYSIPFKNLPWQQGCRYPAMCVCP